MISLTSALPHCDSSFRRQNLRMLSQILTTQHSPSATLCTPAGKSRPDARMPSQSSPSQPNATPPTLRGWAPNSPCGANLHPNGYPCFVSKAHGPFACRRQASLHASRGLPILVILPIFTLLHHIHAIRNHKPLEHTFQISVKSLHAAHLSQGQCAASPPAVLARP